MKTVVNINQTQGLSTTALCDAMGVSKATFYRYQSPRIAPSEQVHSNIFNNAMSKKERKEILDILHSKRFIDQTPYHVFYSLLDEGNYYCSIRTMYRLLAERGETQDRRQQRKHRNAVKPELMATRPNEIWSWDITKLLTFQRLVYFHLYVILDIYSRHVVGWLLAENESQILAKNLIHTTAKRQNIEAGQLTLHADNGPSMRSGDVAGLLENLGILKSHNRPYTSNDNPFSESQFKTLKYCPEFPKRFESFAEAEQFCQRFFDWYNTQHYHSGIAWLHPEQVHYGLAETILEQRYQTLMNVYQSNPLRFNNKPPERKILMSVYINPPQTVSINALQQEGIMV